jgi:hypothetical protein
MQHDRPSPLVRGAIAGILAAVALALWFLIVDLLRGQPFATPTLVAGALLGTQPVAGLSLMIASTAVHFTAFILAGILVAWVFDRLGARPRTLFGLIVGFLFFDIVFYFSVVMTGVDVVRTLGWEPVLLGNLLAGLVLMNALGRMEPGPKPGWAAILAEHRVLREGIVAGAIGAFGVAIWFLALDLARGQVLFTPAALGSAVLFGARGVAEVQITAATVIGYTALHLGSFLLLGLLASALAVAAERQPPLILGFVLLFVVIEVLFIGMVAIAANWLLGALSWWTVAVANLVAAAAMGAYLWHEHPILQKELTGELEERMV